MVQHYWQVENAIRTNMKQVVLPSVEEGTEPVEGSTAESSQTLTGGAAADAAVAEVEAELAAERSQSASATLDSVPEETEDGEDVEGKDVEDAGEAPESDNEA